MMEQRHSLQPAAPSSGTTLRRHHVHVYATIRVKVAVDAPDHLAAMQQADAVLCDHGLAVRLTPTNERVLVAEFAEEITGYLVDEVGDENYARSRVYGADHQPDDASRLGRVS